VGKGIAPLCLVGGGLVAAFGFDLLPSDVVRIRASKDLLARRGVVLLSLDRDHRITETVSSPLILAVAGVSGWPLGPSGRR
jgi:hypothetical protein